MTRTLALTRAVPDSIARCELTHLSRTPIDLARARAQHAAYERALASAGCEVLRLPSLPDHPDSVFVEDVAVVLDELAIATRPGAASRRGEVASAAQALGAHRRVLALGGDATLDGGDVLALGRTLFVGLTRRTNLAGARQLREWVAPFGYVVTELAIEGALHVKTALTRASEHALLVNPRWLPAARFGDFTRIEVDDREPFAANVLWLRGATTLCGAAFPRTNERLRAHGVHVTELDVSELAKAEAGLTCCSLLVG
jgi:dimethylargininase